MKAWRTADEYVYGFCDFCGLPVYKSDSGFGVLPGYEGCQCKTPQLVTFEQASTESDAWAEARDTERRRNAPIVVKPSNYSMWKKRAKRL